MLDKRRLSANPKAGSTLVACSVSEQHPMTRIETQHVCLSSFDHSFKSNSCTGVVCSASLNIISKQFYEVPGMPLCWWYLHFDGVRVKSTKFRVRLNSNLGRVLRRERERERAKLHHPHLAILINQKLAPPILEASQRALRCSVAHQQSWHRTASTSYVQSALRWPG